MTIEVDSNRPGNISKADAQLYRQDIKFLQGKEIESGSIALSSTCIRMVIQRGAHRSEEIFSTPKNLPRL